MTCKNFEGEKLQVSSNGALTLHAWNSTLSNLLVSGGGSASDIFRASGLRVSNETQLALGGGANRVAINDSRFKNFKLVSSGSGTIVRIEAGRSDGTNTQFDGAALFLLGDGADITFSPLDKSDRTIFNSNLLISAGATDALWRYANVRFARRPILNNVEIV